MNTKLTKWMRQSTRTAYTSRLVLLLALPAVVQAQFTFATNNGTITITGYTGRGGAVIIPDTTNGLPVTAIGDAAFSQNPSIASVTIPGSIISIGSGAFQGCEGLSSVTIPSSVINLGHLPFVWCDNLSSIEVDSLNLWYCSVAGVLFDRLHTTLIEYPGGKRGSYAIPEGIARIGVSAFSFCNLLTDVTIPESVTNIGAYAFAHSGLQNVSIPGSVTTIGNNAFYYCSILRLALGQGVWSIGDAAFQYCPLAKVTIPRSVTNIGSWAFSSVGGLNSGIFFEGNAPGIGLYDVVEGCQGATAYYLPGTTGWGVTFATLPTALWQPQVQAWGSPFEVETNGFRFLIDWAAGMPVVVEASTDLTNPAWIPLATNTLTSGSFHFSDPRWTNYPSRFYRLRWP